MKITKNIKNAYDRISDGKCRHTDHKYVRTGLQIEKTWNAHKGIAEIWMISMLFLQNLITSLQVLKGNSLTAKERPLVESSSEIFKTNNKENKKHRGACIIHLQIFSFHYLYLFSTWVITGPGLPVGYICQQQGKPPPAAPTTPPGAPNRSEWPLRLAEATLQNPQVHPPTRGQCGLEISYISSKLVEQSR